MTWAAGMGAGGASAARCRLARAAAALVAGAGASGNAPSGPERGPARVRVKLAAESPPTPVCFTLKQRPLPAILSCSRPAILS